MSEAVTHHRLPGLEPDNLLAFLALLGLLRSLEATPEGNALRARVFWELDESPLRPTLYLRSPVTGDELCAIAAEGLHLLARHNDLGEKHRVDLNYPRGEARMLLQEAAKSATASERGKADVLASLMSDGALKEKDAKDLKSAPIAPTPLCLLFGQGHQHFLERFRDVPLDLPEPLKRGKGRQVVTVSTAECISESLFAAWHRSDSSFSFRWDPEEDVRYALMAGDPAASTYKLGTQHGANQLAAVGLTALTAVPETRLGQTRLSILGGSFGKDGFSISWPIWKNPATFSAIRSMLGHPDLQKKDGLANLSVDHVLTARRISVGKFMNFTRGMTVYIE
jgi:hypothetical protein